MTTAATAGTPGAPSYTAGAAPRLLDTKLFAPRALALLQSPQPAIDSVVTSLVNDVACVWVGRSTRLTQQGPRRAPGGLR